MKVLVKSPCCDASVISNLEKGGKTHYHWCFKCGSRVDLKRNEVEGEFIPRKSTFQWFGTIKVGEAIEELRVKIREALVSESSLQANIYRLRRELMQIDKHKIIALKLLDKLQEDYAKEKNDKEKGGKDN